MNAAGRLPVPDFVDDMLHSSEYYQGIWNLYSALPAFAGYLVPFGLFAFVIVYQLFYTLDFNLLPLHQLLWNIFVYMTPTRLLDSIEEYQRPTMFTNPELRPRTFTAKSESMRRILGIDRPGGIINTVSEVGKKGLSSLPMVGLATQDRISRPPGLGNWDNSCYQNSVLQGLSSLTTISDYLTESLKQSGNNLALESSGLNTTTALRGLIESLKDPSNNGRRLWTPMALKSMSSWQQQDAQEYYSKVLDEIDKEVGKALLRVQAAKGLESPALGTDERTLQATENITATATHNPLEGLIAQRVGCTRCGFSEGLSMIPFNCLTVPLGKAWEHDIFDCLDEYTRLEQIEGVECAKCTLLKHQRLLRTLSERVKEASEDSQLRRTAFERLEAVNLALEEEDFDDKTLSQKCGVQPNSRVSTVKSRQAIIARPPRSLVVHVNRSVFDELTGELRKNYSELRFPMMLDLGPWCLGSLAAIEDPDVELWLLNPQASMIASSRESHRQQGSLYELRAVITHYGRHENGHYIAYKSMKCSDANAEHDKRKWWGFSDDDVISASEDDVLRQGGVFMLFYDCVGERNDVVPRIQENPPHVDGSEIEMSEALAQAACIPLPFIDDSDLSGIDEEESICTATESDKALSSTSVADDDDDIFSKDNIYEPTKSIVIPPPYLTSTGRLVEGQEEQQKHHMPSSLLMV